MLEEIQRTCLLDPFGQGRRMQDTEKVMLECRRIMEGIYYPTVLNFMMELAMSRDRLQQLRGTVGMGLKVDDVRRILMARTYYPPKLIFNMISQDMTKFVWEIPYSQRGRFGTIWQRLRFAIRYKWKRFIA